MQYLNQNLLKSKTKFVYFFLIGDEENEIMIDEKKNILFMKLEMFILKKKGIHKKKNLLILD